MKLFGKTAFLSRAGLAEIQFRAQGGQQEKLLSWCITQQIPLRNVQANDTGFTAQIAAADYAKLHIPARKCRTRLRTITRRGSWFQFRWLLGRPGLVLGPVLFFLILLFSEQFLWATHFVNIPLGQQQQMRLVLQESGLIEGQRVSDAKLEKARLVLLSSSENWGWTALNFYKGRLVLERTQARPVLPIAQKDLRPYKALCDAVVVENLVESGFAQVPVGQSVTAGEVLISSERFARDGTPVTQEPLGKVIGQLEKEYTATCPLEEEYFALTGESCRKQTLLTAFGSVEFPSESFRYASYQTKSYYTPVRIAGIALPATLVDTLYWEEASGKRSLSEQSASIFAHYNCLSQLYREFPDAEILAQSAQESCTETALTYTMRVIVKANIAVKTDSA